LANILSNANQSNTSNVCVTSILYQTEKNLFQSDCIQISTRNFLNIPNNRPWPPCGLLPFQDLLCNRTLPYPITPLPIGSGYFQAKPSPVWMPQQFSNLVILHLPA